METIQNLSRPETTPPVVTPPVNAAVPVSVAGIAGFGLSVSASPVLRVVSGGSTQSVPTLDRIEDVTTGVALVYNYQLAVTRTGDQNAPISYTSTSPTVATVAASGLVTWFAAGKTTIEINHGPVQVNVPLRMGAAVLRPEARIYTGGAVGSARLAAEAAVDAGLVGKTPSTTMAIFSIQDHATATYSRNPANWASAAGIDLTCISPWNSSGGNKRAGVAITPRHIIFAKHYQIGIGATVRFVAGNNIVIDRTLVDKMDIAGTDLTVGLLDSDLPASITPCKFLPVDWEDYFLTGLEHIPALCLDQEEKALVADCGDAGSMLAMRVPTDAARLSFYEAKIVGDSGNPAFLVLGGELILVTTWWYGGAGAGPFIPAFRAEIEAAIVSLGAFGHSLSDAEMSLY